MRLVKTPFFLFLALFFAVMPIHCKIEGISGLRFLACEEGRTAPHSPDDCSTKDCCTFESSVYKAEISKNLLPSPPFVVAVILTLLQGESEVQQLEQTGREINAPPELAPSWQFVSRAALPVRAPSLLS